MPNIRIVLAILACCMLWSAVAWPQDLVIPDNPYDTADPATKERKAFLRERWFYEQRMYPFNRLPDDAYGNALRQRDALRQAQGFRNNGITWANIGPTSGFYFAYGNISGRTTTIKYDPNNPNILYLGAAFGGVWKTTNGGSTWVAKTDFEPSLSSGALAIDPTNSNIIYYGTGEATYSGVSYYGRGLLKSTDGGTTWTHYTAGLEAYTYFSRIVIRPGNPSHLLAALGNRSSPSATGGIYRSTNSGVSWSVVVSGRADDVVFSPTGDTAYAVGSGIGYRISTNGGQSFSTSAALTMQTRNHIAICRSSPSILYAATHASSSISVFKSTNAGTSFSQVAVGTNFSGSQAWYDFYVHVNPFDPNYVYVGSIDIWRSTNGGTSFQNITNGYGGGNVHVDQHNVDFHPTDSNLMFCVNDGGVWRSTDRGTTWTNLNSTLTLTQFYRITSDPSNAAHVLGGTQDNGTQRTTGTMNWAAAFGGDGGEVCFQSQNPSIILGETQYNGIYRSTNGGASWSSSTSGLSGTAAWVAPIISHPDSANIFYTARQSVFKSTNGGASWFSISSGISGTIREMAISRSNPAIMFATIGSAVYRSTDRGATWSSVSSGLPSRTITSVSVHPESSNVVLLSFSGFGTGKVYRSTNTGTTWTNITGNLPDTPVNDALIHYPGFSTGTYFVATDVGVFVTENYGSTWAELADGLPNTVAMHMDYHAATKKLRVGTHGRGVYETTLDDATVAVTVPNGGEQWTVGSNRTIQWSASGFTGNVRIELSRNGGGSFTETLFADTPNDGSEVWTVSGPPTSAGRVRVVSISNPSVSGTSAGDFTIGEAAIAVVSPNGGESWPTGSARLIQWTASFLPGNVAIELSRDGGGSYEVLFASTPNDGSQSWLVSGIATTQALVRVSSVDMPSASDVSNGVFRLTSPQFPVLAYLEFRDNGTGVGAIEFGTALGGTDGIDPLLGESELPPRPPAGAFDVRWQIVGTQGSQRDVRDTLKVGRLQQRYSATIQPGSGGYPFIVRWLPSLLPPKGIFRLKDGGTGGLLFDIDMRLRDSLVITNAAVGVVMVDYAAADTVPLPATVGWNMLSVPVTVPDLRRSVLFPPSASVAFGFVPGQGYYVLDTLRYAEGFWLKFPDLPAIQLYGALRDIDTVDVLQGWNLIGSISYPVPVDSVVRIPPEMAVVWGGYGVPPTVITPGTGVWVKCSQNGRLVLRAPGFVPSLPNLHRQSETVRVE